MLAAAIDPTNAYDRVDRRAMWQVLKIYVVRGRGLRAVEDMYEGAKAAVRVDVEWVL